MADEKVTYILGAGASIGTFPLVKPTGQWENQGLAVALFNQGDGLKNAPFSIKEPFNSTRDKIAAAMMDTGEQAKAFGNVDSYAKYLYHTEQTQKLSDLKLALTYYFVRQQICKDYLYRRNEFRYLNFITSLIGNENKFSNRVKVLNWNYDFLFQLAAMVYKPEKIVRQNNQNLVLPPFIDYYPNYEVKKTLKTGYPLIHLNGIAGIAMEPNAEDPFPFRNIIIELLAGSLDTQITEHQLLSHFHAKYIHLDQLITFAWEIQSPYRQHVSSWPKTSEIVKANVKDTNILVVIGYSFPFYNRETDNMIFETIKPSLQKIYFQDPKPNNNGEFLRKRYGLSKEAVTIYEDEPKFTPVGTRPGIDIEHITDTDQFYIPIEV